MPGWSEPTVIEYPVWPLNELREKHGSDEAMTQAAAQQLVESLVEFGVSPLDIQFHLVEVSRKLIKEQ